MSSEARSKRSSRRKALPDPSHYVGKEYGCRRIVGFVVEEDGRVRYEWECGASGSSGVNYLYQLRQSDLCRKCWRAEHQRKVDETPFKTTHREILGAVGNTSGGGRLYRWRCKKCGAVGVGGRTEIEEHKHCSVCNPGKQRHDIVDLAPGDHYGEKLVVERLHGHILCRCDKGHESTISFSSVRQGKGTSCRICASDLTGRIINGREVLGHVYEGTRRRWRVRCVECEEIYIASSQRLRNFRCACSKKLSVKVGTKKLYVEDLAKLSGLSRYTVLERLRNGSTALEVIFGKRRNRWDSYRKK